MTKATKILDALKGGLQPKKPNTTRRDVSSPYIELSRDVVVRDADENVISPPSHAYRSVFSFQRYQKPSESKASD